MLKITNLQKTFNPGTVNAKTALCGLYLTLDDGDFVTAIGGNGAGKSTLLNAIAHGNRLIMMHEGRIIVDVRGEEKQKLTVEDLLGLFAKASGKAFANDRVILS